MHTRPPGLTDLRVFGIGVAILAVVGVARIDIGWVDAVLAVVGGTAAVVGLVKPTLLRGPYRWWMMLFTPVGIAITTVLLAAVYFLVLTPLAMVARRHVVRLVPLDADSTLSSYWEPSDDTTSVERSFRQY